MITNGVMTLAQLQALGGVSPVISAPPTGQANFGWLRATDLRLAWRHTFKDRYTIEPSMGLFNLFNFANFNLLPEVMTSLLNGSTQSLNGTTTSLSSQGSLRVGNGTGVYSLGSPRQLEFGLRLTF